MAEGPLTVRMSKSDSVETLTNPAGVEDMSDGIWVQLIEVISKLSKGCWIME